MRDDGHVAVAPPPALLVDVDLAQAVELVAAAVALDPAFDDLAHAAPADPQQLRDGGLVLPLREPGDLVLEGVGGPAVRGGEGHRLGDDAVLRAAQPPQRHAQEAAPASEIQVAPAPLGSAVIHRARGERAAWTAQARGPAQADIEDEPVRGELDAGHADLWKGQQATQYCGVSHPDLLDGSSLEMRQTYRASGCSSFFRKYGSSKPTEPSRHPPKGQERDFSGVEGGSVFRR